MAYAAGVTHLSYDPGTTILVIKDSGSTDAAGNGNMRDADYIDASEIRDAVGGTGLKGADARYAAVEELEAAIRVFEKDGTDGAGALNNNKILPCVIHHNTGVRVGTAKMSTSQATYGDISVNP